MDCRTTPTKRSRRGATLVETLVALLLGAILATVIAAFMVYTARNFAALSNCIDLDQRNQTAIDHMTRSIRQAQRVTAFATNQVTVLDTDGATLTYAYDPAARTLTRTKGTESTVLLSEVDAFAFAMMQRNIIAKTFNNYPTTDVNQCKILGVYWNCSRTLLGQKSSVSGGQSTRVAIRSI